MFASRVEPKNDAQGRHEQGSSPINRCHPLEVATGPLFSVLFLSTSAVGWWLGMTMPTTAPIKWMPAIRWLGKYERNFGYILLTLAAAGALARWAAGYALSSRIQAVRLQRADEIRAQSALSSWGLVIAVSLMLFSCSAQWAGLVRLGDISNMSIGGLIPFTDAAGYFADAHDQVKTGAWSDFSARRPVAAALRTTLLAFAGYSSPRMLALQGILLGVLLAVASGAVLRWLGLWAGLAFFAMTFIVSRGFATTILTEPLGLSLALASVPFFVSALQGRSANCALIAFTFVVFALMARMGAMFVIPAVALWIVWRFADDVSKRLRLGVVAVTILLGTAVLNKCLNTAYSSGQEVTGSNFAYVLCGLSIGDMWSACGQRYAEEIRGLPQSERDRTAFMYGRAFENIRSNPGVFVGRLIEGAIETVSLVSEVLIRGYTFIPPPAWFSTNSLITLFVLGLWTRWRRRIGASEKYFWLLLFPSIVASGAFVQFDDGARVLSACYPLAAALLASGFASHRPRRPNVILKTRRLERMGVVGLVSVVVMMLFVPALARAWRSQKFRQVSAWHLQPAQQVVLGGASMLGFLVVGDSEAPDPRLPSMQFSDFRRLIAQSGVEQYQGLFTPAEPTVPFGFVSAVRAERELSSQYHYIVPPEVLLRREVAYWRFDTIDWNKKDWPYWVMVTRAVPEVLPMAQ